MKYLCLLLFTVVFSLSAEAQTFSGISKYGYKFYLRIHSDSTILLVRYNSAIYVEDTGTIRCVNDTFKITAVTKYAQAGDKRFSPLGHLTRFVTEELFTNEEGYSAYCDSIEIKYFNGRKTKFVFKDKKSMIFESDRYQFNHGFEYYLNTFHRNPITHKYYIQKVCTTDAVSLSAGDMDNEEVLIKNNLVTPVASTLMDYGFFELKKQP